MAESVNKITYLLSDFSFNFRLKYIGTMIIEHFSSSTVNGFENIGFYNGFVSDKREKRNLRNSRRQKKVLSFVIVTSFYFMLDFSFIKTKLSSTC